MYEFEDDDEAMGILATGIWQYQHWVLQTWDEKQLDQICDFFDKKHLDEKIAEP